MWNFFLKYCVNFHVLFFQHTSRVFHNESGDITKTDSGFLFTNLDRNSPQSVRKYIPDLARAKSVAQDCEVALFCGLPLVHTRAIGILYVFFV